MSGTSKDRARRASAAASAGRYVVEVKLIGDYPDVRALCVRARAAAEALSLAGTRVRFVRAVFVPEDSACLLVFEAATTEAARAAASAAGLEVAQVSDALTIDGP